MRLAPLFCLLLCGTTLANELDGHYQGLMNEQPTELILRSSGETLSGEYVENRQSRYPLSGRLDGQVLKLRVNDPVSGETLANINANYANDMLNAVLATRHPQSGETLVRDGLFQRIGPAPDPSLDPTLVGTWVNEREPHVRDGQLLAPAQITTLRIRADGSIAQWARQVGGGSEWSYDRPGELQYSGRWRSDDGLLLVRLKGAADFQPAAHYRFDQPYLVTRSNTGEMKWQRR
ncbi:hypothetical protein AAFN46_01150 [Pseudomonas sp. CAU 1711]|uniref:hypothetical protein n=1 Tax=Pseudomonas sp. CAU 1711 TaxID=3140356 RepID=UPI00326009C0